MKSNMIAKFISYTLYLYKNVKYFLVTLETALEMTHNIFYLSKANKQKKLYPSCINPSLILLMVK